jgi:hypothetical protein
MTPPAMILLPQVFQGYLLWGCVSHALSKKWLRYKKVRLVVNCNNKRTPDGIMNPLWEETAWARAGLDEVRFIDWSGSLLC